MDQNKPHRESKQPKGKEVVFSKGCLQLQHSNKLMNQSLTRKGFHAWVGGGQLVQCLRGVWVQVLWAACRASAHTHAGRQQWWLKRLSAATWETRRELGILHLVWCVFWKQASRLKKFRRILSSNNFLLCSLLMQQKKQRKKLPQPPAPSYFCLYESLNEIWKPAGSVLY